jgi:hypothetical protein
MYVDDKAFEKFDKCFREYNALCEVFRKRWFDPFDPPGSENSGVVESGSSCEIN